MSRAVEGRMTPAELIQWHEREAERFDEGGRGWREDGHEAQAEAWFEDAAFHRSAAETVRRLVEGLERAEGAIETWWKGNRPMGWSDETHAAPINRYVNSGYRGSGRGAGALCDIAAERVARRALAGAPTDEDKRA